MAKKRICSIIILSIMTLLLLFTASCNSNLDTGINISNQITNEAYTNNGSTTIHFYLKSNDYSFDDYQTIKVNLDYYVNHSSLMKYKEKIINVPDDLIVEGEKKYFVVEIDDVLTSESVVYTTVMANYESEETSPWIYVVTVIIAVAMCAILTSTYVTMCQNFDSDSSTSALMWLGGLVLYAIVAGIVGASWGLSACYIILGSGVLYFLVTLIPYFMYK